MSQKEYRLVNFQRRSIALLCACGLGFGLILLTMICAARPSLVQAQPEGEAASAMPSANVQAAPGMRAVDLEVGKQGPDEIYVTQRLSYTINITNHTGATINGIVLTDTWAASNKGEPAKAEQQPTFDSYYETTPPGLVSTLVSTQPLVWELNPLGAAEVGAIRFWLDVPADLQPLKAVSSRYDVGPSVVGNSVEAVAAGVTVNEADQVVTAIQGPVFQLKKSSFYEPDVGPRPGRQITYVLQLENLERTDAIPATGIIIGETLPDDLIFESAAAENDPGATIEYDLASRHITWTLTSMLDVGEILSVTFTVRLPVDQERDVKISNNKDDCWAISNELGQPVYCWAVYRVTTLGMLDKTYVTEPSALPPDQSYQNRYVTYTVYAFNPLSDTALSNLYITDVMPPTWDFISMVGVDAPQPVNTGDITDTVTWHWPGSDVIAPNGVLTFSFVALIGPHTPVNYGYSSCTKNYYNDMAASADELPIVYQYGKSFGLTKNGLAELGVTEQVKLNKSVDSGLGGIYKSKQYPGELVTYTVSLENVGDRLVTNIIFTDTLYEYFTYVETVEGPEPLSILTGTIAWSLGSLSPDEVKEIVFQVRVDGYWNKTHKNSVSGISDQSLFCSGLKAGLTLLAPLQYDKTADPDLVTSDDWVVQEEWFDYTVEYYNRSNLRYELSAFQDNLPAGFETDGSSTYIVLPPDADLPLILLPDYLNSWTHTFSTTVVGDEWDTEWCNALRIDEDGSNPNKYREIYQEAPGTFDPWPTVGFGVDIAPLDYAGITTTAVNGKKAGPVLIKPHADVRQIVYPKKGGMGDTVVVTLTLVNNTRNYHGATAQGISNIDMTYTIPSGFSLIEIISPTQPPSKKTDEIIAWRSLYLPPVEGAQENFYLRLQAPPEEDTPRGYVVAEPGDKSFCIPPSEAKYYVVKGVEVDKRPDEPSVGPFGTAQYNLKLYNRTTAPVTGLVITDTLPKGFSFVSVLPGNPLPYSTDPLVWRDLAIDPSKSLEIRYKVRASGLFGVYYNWIEGVSDSTNVAYTRKYTENVALGVLPGVALYKLVNTEQAEAGSTVVYTLTVDNRIGPDAAITNVTVTDTLPLGFSYQGMVSGGEPAVTPDGLVWTVPGELGYEQKAQFVFSALIDDQAFNGNYCNQASATAFDANDPSEEVLIPDTDMTACVRVAGLPTIERSKIASPTEVQAGGLVTYTIYLYNDTGEAQTVYLTDTLPEAMTYFGVLGGTPTPAITSPVVWDGLSMTAGEYRTLTFQARVDLQAESGTYFNRLDASTDQFVLPPEVELAPVYVGEIPRYDLQANVSDQVVRVQEGDTLQYTIVYTNANEVDLALGSVAITNTFAPQPPYATPVDLDPGWEALGANVYRYTASGLASGQSGSVQFSLQLSSTIPTATEVISNQVEVLGYAEGGQRAIESNPVNNTHTDLDILRGVDLVVTRVDISPAQPKEGQDINLAVTVRSQGSTSPVNTLDSSNWFSVELYVKGSAFEPSGPPKSVFDHSGGWWCLDYPICPEMRDEYLQSFSGLGAEGSEGVVYFTITLAQADDYDVYVQVDPNFEERGFPWDQKDGLVREVFEDNNIYTHKTKLSVSGDSLVYLPLIIRD